MPTEEELNARIGELETELDDKEHEIIAYLDRIEQLEETVMRLEALAGDTDKKKGKKGKDSKLAIELEDRDKEVRELKNKLGYLRKEKIQLQQELDKIAREQNQSNVIRIEEKKSPLDALVSELQGKINKQRLLITKLKQASMSADAAELNEKLRLKDEDIEELNKKITELEERVKSSVTASESKATDKISKALTEELQTKLNKAKKQIEALKQKASKKGKGKSKSIDSKSDELYEQIEELKEEINSKSKKIEELKAKVESAGGAGAAAGAGGPVAALTEELQSKLNKAKIQIKTLQEQLKGYKAGKTPVGASSEAEVEGELQMQKELVISLQQQIEEQKSLLSSKDGEIMTAKNDAVQNQIKCEDLENTVILKDQKIQQLLAQLSNMSSQPGAAPAENPHVALRLRELKNLIEDLNKQTIQQRAEISELRKT